jgi:hypothetical protein
MSGSIGDWTRMYRQALASLEPGGWIEIQEFEVWFYSQAPGGLPEDSAITRWQTLIDEASLAFGRRLNYASRFQAHLEEAGFVGIQTQRVKVSEISTFDLHDCLFYRHVSGHQLTENIVPRPR